VKTNRLYFSIIFLTLISMNVTTWSQGTNIITGRENRIYIGFNVSPVQTGIINTGTPNIKDLDWTKKTSVFASFEAGYYFSKYIGVTIGLGYNLYNTELYLKSYSAHYDTTDADLESYTRYITGDEINETQKIGFLSIPISIHFNVPVTLKFGVDVQAGINVSVPLTKKYSSSGTFEYYGYYPVYKVTIRNVGYEDFSSNIQNDVNNKLLIKSINPELIAYAGCYYFFRDRIQMALGFFYESLLTDLSGYTVSNNFIISSVHDQMKSMMEGSSKTTTQAMGLKISFRYYLK
jgi:hypothetical protein